MFSELVGRMPHMPLHVECEVNELELIKNPKTLQEASHSSLGSRIGKFSPNNGKILLNTILFPTECGLSFGSGKLWDPMQKMVAPDAFSENCRVTLTTEKQKQDHLLLPDFLELNLQVLRAV